MKDVVINGRFLTQPVTGVQRFARQIVRALDDLVAEDDTAPRLRLVVPRGAVPLPGLRCVGQLAAGRLRGHLWEQWDLARAARGALLVNLGATGPLSHDRFLVTMHDAQVYTRSENYSPAFVRWYRFLMPRLGRRARRVLTVSQFSRGELARHCGLAAERFAVVPNGADHLREVVPEQEFLAEHRISVGRYVLALGSASPNKNFAAVARAFELLADDDLVLVLAGGRAEKVFRAAPPPRGRRVVVLGHVSDGPLKALYSHALCFVFPSFHEGFGIPPLEAMSCGCPVVVADSSSLPEVCGDAALYCDPRDPATLATCIAAIRDDTPLADELAERGLRRAAAFTWRGSARQVLDLIRENL